MGFDMVDMIIADLSGTIPGQSLMSIWEARKEQPRFIQALHSGVNLDEPSLGFFPPPGAVIQSALCIGLPSQMKAHAASLARAGVDVDILVLGIGFDTDWIVPVIKKDLAPFRNVYAYAETAAYLERHGLWTIKRGYPWSSDLCIVRLTDTPGCVTSDTGLDALSDLGKDFSTSVVRWKTKENRVRSPNEIAELVSRTDVYVASKHILDDPIGILAEQGGALSISLRGTAQDKQVHTAKHLALSSLGLIVPKTGLPLPEGPQPKVNLGVVIPFGGLDVAPLAMVLNQACMAFPPPVPIVLSHQRSSTRPHDAIAWEDEVAQVQEALPPHHPKIIYGESEFGGSFNLPMARNNGESALPAEVTHVLFLDADVLVDPEFYSELIEEARIDNTKVLVPYLRTREGVGLAPGLATYPREAFARATGFDFVFRELGYEDIDMISAVRARGFEAVSVTSPASPYLVHIDHEDRWANISSENLKYLMEKLAMRRHR
jgi:hypothetical protein